MNLYLILPWHFTIYKQNILILCLISGTLTWDYAWFLFCVGLVATCVGQFGVAYLIERYNRYSYISLSIGGVVLVSTCLLGFQGMFSLLFPDQRGGASSNSIC